MEINNVTEEDLLIDQLAQEQPVVARTPAVQQVPVETTVLAPGQELDPTVEVMPPVDARATPEDPTGGLSIGTQGLDTTLNAFYDVKQGGQQEIEALAQAQEQEAAITSEAVKVKGEINREYQEKLNEIRAAETKAVEDYHETISTAGKELDPNRWWNSLSTGGKIQAGVAQIMAGLGGNRINPIGNAVKADIEAQKENYLRDAKKAKGIYAYFKGKGKSDREAALLSYTSALTQVKNNIDLGIMKLKPGQTRSKAMAAGGRIDLEKAKVLRQLKKEALDRSAKKAKEAKEGRLQLGSEQQNKFSFVSNAVGDLTRLQNLLKEGAWTTGRGMFGDTAYKSAERRVVNAILRMESGAAIKVEEADEMRLMLPRKGMSQKVQKDNLRILMRQLKDRGNLILSTAKGGVGEQPKPFKIKKYKVKK